MLRYISFLLQSSLLLVAIGCTLLLPASDVGAASVGSLFASVWHPGRSASLVDDDEVVRVIRVCPVHYSGTPTLIQHTSTANNGYPGTGNNWPYSGIVSQFTTYLPNPALSGNCLILGITAVNSVTINTPTDDSSYTVTPNTWIAGPTGNDAGNGTQAAIFYCPNVLAGTRAITVTFSNFSAPANSTYCSVKVSEFQNIALASPADGSSSHVNSSGTSWTSGSLTTANSGDLVWNFCVISNQSPTTSWTGGSGFSLLDADVIDAFVQSASQFQVQSSAGAINPGVTLGTARPGISLSIALTAATAGTPAPSGIRIVRMLRQSASGVILAARSTYTSQFPCSGNLLVLTPGAGGTLPITFSAADTNSNSWATAVTCTTVGASGSSYLLYAAAATTSSNMTVTITVNQNISYFAYTMFDIAGAAASPLGNSNGTDGQQTTNGPLLTCAVTPSQANGLIICCGGVDQFAVLGVNGAFNGFLFDPPINPMEDAGNDQGTQGDIIAHVYNTSTSQYTFSFTTTGFFRNGVDYWSACCAEFKASSPSNPGYAGPFTSASVTFTGVVGYDTFWPWICPHNIPTAKWQLYGGSGAGSQSATSTTGGGGGKGGDYSDGVQNVTPGNCYLFVCGGGGVSGTGSFNGSTNTLPYTARYGSQGVDTGLVNPVAASGNSAAYNSGTGASGSSGTTAAGTGGTTHTGGNGGAGGSSNSGGGGGGGAGSTGNGGTGGNGTTVAVGAGGSGGTGSPGGGGGGAGGLATGLNPPGSNGSTPGGAGGGGYDGSASSLGGNGAPGQVIITGIPGWSPFLPLYIY